MARIKISASAPNMAANITDVPAFPGERFGIGFPESIGDVRRAQWVMGRDISWTEMEDGAWKCECSVEGGLSYSFTVTPHSDTVHIVMSLTNESDRSWPESMAFNCFQVGAAPSLCDRECVRHWVRTADGEFKRLIQVPRHFGPRPTIQLYSVKGAPRGEDIPFVANFKATPEDVVLEGWMAVESRDGGRLAAVVAKPSLFLFQNMEYSCIHSGAGFGPLDPGQTGTSQTWLYFVESSVEEWHARMIEETT